jgi:hypothetical protein
VRNSRCKTLVASARASGRVKFQRASTAVDNGLCVGAQEKQASRSFCMHARGGAGDAWSTSAFSSPAHMYSVPTRSPPALDFFAGLLLDATVRHLTYHRLESHAPPASSSSIHYQAPSQRQWPTLALCSLSACSALPRALYILLDRHQPHTSAAHNICCQARLPTSALEVLTTAALPGAAWSLTRSI